MVSIFRSFWHQCWSRWPLVDCVISCSLNSFLELKPDLKGSSTRRDGASAFSSVTLWRNKDYLFESTPSFARGDVVGPIFFVPILFLVRLPLIEPFRVRPILPSCSVCS